MTLPQWFDPTRPGAVKFSLSLTRRLHRQLRNAGIAHRRTQVWIDTAPELNANIYLACIYMPERHISLNKRVYATVEMLAEWRDCIEAEFVEQFALDVRAFVKG